MSPFAGWAPIALSSVGLLGIVLAVYLAFVRARRAERRLASMEKMLKTQVIPYLERRVRAAGAESAKGPAVILGADGSLVVTGEMSAAHAVGRLVGQLEKIEEHDHSALAMSDTEQIDTAPSKGGGVRGRAG